MKKMGRREGRFPGAPNRVLREGKRATKRVSTSSLSSTTTSNSAMEVARGVERGIRAFNNLVGEEETEVKIQDHPGCHPLFCCKNLPSQR